MSRRDIQTKDGVVVFLPKKGPMLFPVGET